MKNRKYIIICIGLLFIFYIFHNTFFLKIYKFNKAEDYVFIDKKSNEVLKECKKLYNNLGDKNEMLNLVKIIQLSDYLLYEDSIEPDTYYDLMMTIVSLEKRDNIKNKESYSIEIEKYLNRKRKTNIKYIKYEASEPVFHSYKGNENAYVIAKIYWDSGIHYLKYDFIYEDGFWHFDNAKPIDKVKEKG